MLDTSYDKPGFVTHAGMSYEERQRVYQRRHYLKHKEREKEDQKKYASKNRKKETARVNKYRVKHPEMREHMRRKSKEWALLFPEKVKARNHRRRAHKLGSSGSFTAQEFSDLCALYGNVCLCCHKTREELKSLRRTLTPDHVVPLVKGGSNDISNIQPLCHGRGGCNNHKSAKIIDYRGTND